MVLVICAVLLLSGFIYNRQVSNAENRFQWTNTETSAATVKLCLYSRGDRRFFRVRVNRKRQSLQYVDVRQTRGDQPHFVFRRINPDRFEQNIKLNDNSTRPRPKFILLVKNTPNAPAQQIVVNKSDVINCRASGYAVQAHDIPGNILSGLRLCESGGDYQSVSPGNLYFGAYQFSPSTWRSLGEPFSDHENAGEAPARLQDAAVKVHHKRQGNWSAWPVCGQGLRNNFETTTLYL